MSDTDFRALPKRPDVEPLMRQVESIGISCELGLVQRHCLAEPMGLFRFGYTPLAGLVAALNAAFDGIGDPAQLDLREARSREWISTHRRYGFEFHTEHNAARHSEAAVRKMLERHLTFLARKLMEDLATGDKLFVYRPENAGPPGDDAFELLEAMMRFGSPVLMWVDVASDPALVGAAEWALPRRLMTGYLDRYADIRFAAGASLEGWLRLVKAGVAAKARVMA